jgi:hypothetical protein
VKRDRDHRQPDLPGLEDPRTTRDLPDVRDGLTRVDRVVLVELHRLEVERPGRMVPSALLYGRVVERGVVVKPEEFQRILQRLGAGRISG